jgi:hypothetical protein
MTAPDQMNEVEKYVAEHGTTPLHDRAREAMAEFRKWMESPEFDEMINQMPREMAIQYLTRIATDKNLEEAAVMARHRADRQYGILLDERDAERKALIAENKALKRILDGDI